jgi:hypothetical protein
LEEPITIRESRSQPRDKTGAAGSRFTATLAHTSVMSNPGAWTISEELPTRVFGLGKSGEDALGARVRAVLEGFGA